MCIPVGIVFSCGCYWTEWLDCPAVLNGDCTVKMRLIRPPKGLPDPGQGVDHRFKDYNKHARAHSLILPVTWCCGPAHCGYLIATAPSYISALFDHLSRCPKRFTEGLGMLNCMEDDIGRVRTTGAPFTINANATATLSTLPPDRDLAEYVSLYNIGRGLQSVRFAARSAMEHYLAIRLKVLDNPMACVNSMRQPPPGLLNEFQQKQVQYGMDSKHAAQTAFDWDSVVDIIPSLYTLGGVNARNRARPAPLLPAPITVALQTIKAPVNLERFKDVEDAIRDVFAAATGLPDLPNTADDEAIADRDVQLRPFTAQLQLLTTASQNGNRIDGDKTLLNGRLGETIPVVQAKLRPVGLPLQQNPPFGGSGGSGKGKRPEYPTATAGGRAAPGGAYSQQPARPSASATRGASGPSYKAPGEGVKFTDVEARNNFAFIRDQINRLDNLSNPFESAKHARDALKERKDVLTKASMAVQATNLAIIEAPKIETYQARDQAKTAIRAKLAEVKSREREGDEATQVSTADAPAPGLGQGSDPVPTYPRAPTFPAGGGQSSSSGGNSYGSGQATHSSYHPGFSYGAGQPGNPPYGGGSGLNRQPSTGDLNERRRGRGQQRPSASEAGHSSTARPSSTDARPSSTRRNRPQGPGNNSRSGSASSNLSTRTHSSDGIGRKSNNKKGAKEKKEEDQESILKNLMGSLNII